MPSPETPDNFLVCRIVSGRVESARLAEGAHVIASMDIVQPLSPKVRLAFARAINMAQVVLALRDVQEAFVLRPRALVRSFDYFDHTLAADCPGGREACRSS